MNKTICDIQLKKANLGQMQTMADRVGNQLYRINALISKNIKVV